MKKLGIIGGAGPLASALLYETLVRECYLQKLPLPEIFLLNYPFSRLASQIRIERDLQYAIEILVEHRVDIALLACNTLHAHLGRPSIPFFSLPEATLQEALRQGKKQLLILGTEETQKNQLYGAACYPDQEGQLLVNQVIDHILEGEICEEDAILLSRYIATTSVEGVVLGCTDLPVLHHHFPIACEVPIFDSIKIPAKNILRGIL